MQGSGETPNLADNNLDPFRGWDKTEMNERVDSFLETSGLQFLAPYLRRGAFLAQNPDYFGQDSTEISKEERHYLNLERQKDRWNQFKQPWQVYALIFCCSLGAAVQGWDESAINGGQFHPRKQQRDIDS
jgi:hypothetical protein